jgi:molecular chaperone HtpG
MAGERMAFQAEVSRLLDIVARSLYSNRDVFLRELISNASDACDKLRYAALTNPDLAAGDSDFRVRIALDKEAGTITVADNGIGMDRDDLVDNLGTIARSGTGTFLEQLTGDAKKDMALIGQFGVGFYSAFMVADRVDVITRKAGTDQGWRWTSDGKGSFEIEERDGVDRGTRVVLHLSEEAGEYRDPGRLEQIVRAHSDHIAIPVELVEEPGAEPRRINRAAALWTRPKSEISEEEYKDFYHHVGQGFDDPWLTIHTAAEGTIAFTALLFVPSSAPFDLYDPARAHRVRLYVRRVMVSEGAEGLVPAYLRFLRGVIDSEDLPLNISREMLQSNRLVAKIRDVVTKRVLDRLVGKAKDDGEGYERFWEAFGAVLKEGLYEDTARREALIPLLRFRTTKQDGWVDLAAVKARMKPGQEALYFMTGDNLETLKASPQLEGFRAKGVEVLLLTDPIDDFWTGAMAELDGTPLKSVTRGAADLDCIEGEAPSDGAERQADKPDAKTTGTLVARLKTALEGKVKDIRASQRLTDSPVCLVADEGDMDIRLERLLREHKQIDSAAKRVLEINPSHPLLTAMAAMPAGPAFDEMSQLLLDQALIVEGEPLPDPAGFSRRLADALARSATGA